MGLLLEGKWVDALPASAESTGAFVRAEAGIRNYVTADGAPGPSGEGGFAAASGRYHLYVSMACPWAHRVLIMRELKGLASHIDISVVGSDMLDSGWQFTQPGTTGDALFGVSSLHEIYTRADPAYTGRVTVPVLWDTERDTMVSNESSEIIRMFNSAFNAITGNEVDFYPAQLRPEIDRINDLVYDSLNNGVYRCGFATSQQAYDEAFAQLFDCIETLEVLLGKRRYIAGDQLTEADWRLLPTLLRFDPVYFGHFKCNRKRISDCPNLLGYTRELYQMPGIAGTFDLDSTKRHYYYSHESVNPTRIVPQGPDVDYAAPHHRAVI